MDKITEAAIELLGRIATGLNNPEIENGIIRHCIVTGMLCFSAAYFIPGDKLKVIICITACFSFSLGTISFFIRSLRRNFRKRQQARKTT